jgi:hypothetical protein
VARKMFRPTGEHVAGRSLRFPCDHVMPFDADEGGGWVNGRTATATLATGSKFCQSHLYV